MEPRGNPFLAGHRAAETAFEDALAAGRLHHAWLITGPPGIGKATLAFRFARRLFAGSGQPAHDPALPLFRRVAEGSHSDLLTIEREIGPKGKLRTEIVVDTVRAAPEFLHLTPAEGGWRVVVVDGSETLNRNAANGLLKVLEEPPARSVLILTCAAPGRLPATIRSRCRLLRLQPLDPVDMAAALQSVMPAVPESDRATLIGLSGGAPGRAVALQGEGVEIAGLVTEVLRAPVPFVRAQAIADKVARAEEGYTEFMDGLRGAIAGRVRAQAIAGAGALAASCDLWHTLGRLQDETERSRLDQRHAITSALHLLHGSLEKLQ